MLTKSVEVTSTAEVINLTSDSELSENCSEDSVQFSCDDRNSEFVYAIDHFIYMHKMSDASGIGIDVKLDNRRHFVDWICLVAEQFNFPRDVVHLAVNMTDQYLPKNQIK